MRIRFQKADLIGPASTVNSVANSQSTLPILNNVLIRTDSETQITLIATDYETRAIIEVPAQVEAKGSCTVPARTFYEIVSNLPEDSEITLEYKDSRAIVSAGVVRAELQTMPAADFPKLHLIENEQNIQLPQAALGRLLDKVAFAIPTRDPRKVLLGSLVVLKRNSMLAVATDGKILAYASTPFEAPLESFGEEQQTQFLLPHKLVQETLKLIDAEGTVALSYDEKQVAFRTGKTLLISNKLEGNYPNYEAVVPKSFSREIRFHKGVVQDALRRASYLSDIKTNAVMLNFHGTELVVEAESYDRGRLAETLTLLTESDDFKAVFNYRFLINVLRNLDGEEVRLMANQPTTPMVFRSTVTEDNYYLVMPIKVTEARPAPPVASAGGASNEGPEDEPPVDEEDGGEE